MNLRIGRRIGLVLGALGAATALAQYENGFEWSFPADYGEGAVEGASVAFGNPQTDTAGLTPWTFEWVPEGQALDGSPPWFEGQPRLMTWDPDYFGFRRWSKANNAGANLEQGYMEQIIFPGADRAAPVIRWTNLTGRPVTVEVRDQPRLHWWQGTTATIEVALTKFSSFSLTHTVLHSASRQRPAIPGVGESEDLNVGPLMVLLEPGDSLTLSVRAIGSGVCCIGMDTDLTITLLTGGDCPIDTNGDREVNFTDITTVLGNWLSVCP